VRTVSFRVTITLAVLALITALAVCVITIQLLALHAAAKEAASAYMDAAAAATESKLEAQIYNSNRPRSGTIAEPISRGF
jgi:adenylate cyclase